RALAAKATPGGLETWEIARVEAGRPEWGVDIDESTLPQEANFEELHAISYTKGCYTGQETVARVHFRGHVNKHLRGLRAASAEPPAPRASLFDATGKNVGDVRSTAASPRLGGIAMGMVRREIEVGAALIARWEGGETRVDVAHLPFPASRGVPTALVTGATGLVGSHIIERLAQDGWRVRALVRDADRVRQSSDKEWDGLRWLRERGAELATGDILDLPSFADAARGCDVIFHTAAAVTPAASRIHAYDAYRIPNVDGTRNAIAVAAQNGARLLQLSSVAVYGPKARYTSSKATGVD